MTLTQLNPAFVNFIFHIPFIFILAIQPQTLFGIVVVVVIINLNLFVSAKMLGKKIKITHHLILEDRMCEDKTDTISRFRVVAMWQVSKRSPHPFFEAN